MFPYAIRSLDGRPILAGFSAGAGPIFRRFPGRWIRGVTTNGIDCFYSYRLGLKLELLTGKPTETRWPTPSPTLVDPAQACDECGQKAYGRTAAGLLCLDCLGEARYYASPDRDRRE